jgi:hypothetical protein
MSGPPAIVIEAIATSATPFIAAMERRNLTTALATLGDQHFEEQVATATAVVVIAGPRKSGVVKDKVTSVIRLALDYGTHFVLAVPADEINLYQDWFKVEQERPVSHAGGLAYGSVTLLISEPRIVANHVVSLGRWPIATTSLSIEPSGFPKDLGVLVQRAFNRFDRITLTTEQGGKTSKTYRVDAMRGALRPLPFLMKIGKRGKIAEEYDNFVDNVSDYVPFSSRPDLVRERCVLGSESGVLVAHFIEHSEPLHELLLRAPSPRLLHSVFEDLLRGWWRLGERDTQTADKRVLAGLEEWCDPTGKPERVSALLKHSALASAKGGGLHDPDEIKARLLAVAVPHRRSLIHGDLHTGNIHVRGSEPFLIDFGSVIEGPILADPAMLEASLVLAVGIECTDPAAFTGWEQLTASELYPPTGEREVPRRDPPPGLTRLLQRLWEAVRVIRMHVVAMRVSAVEYPTLIAAAFLRQASFDDAEPVQRTTAVAHLYSIASRIVDGLP